MSTREHIQLGWHKSVHYPMMEIEAGQRGDGLFFQVWAMTADGFRALVWERTFTGEETKQLWERGHIRMHMTNDQATAMREDAINIAQWGRDYGIFDK